MNVARGLKRYDLILSFLLLSRTNIGSKTFFRSLWKVWVLCEFFEFELSQNYRDVTAIISHGVSFFLLNASLMTTLVNFIFHIMKIFNFRHKLAFEQMLRF